MLPDYARPTISHLAWRILLEGREDEFDADSFYVIRDSLRGRLLARGRRVVAAELELRRPMRIARYCSLYLTGTVLCVNRRGVRKW